MEFKNLAEVELLGEVPEGASVLAATAEGEVVRVPGDGLGGGGEMVVFDVEMNYGSGHFTASCSVSFDEFKKTFAARGITAITARELYGGDEYGFERCISCAGSVCPRVGAEKTFDIESADNFYIAFWNMSIYFLSDGSIHDGDGDDPVYPVEPEDPGTPE